MSKRKVSPTEGVVKKAKFQLTPAERAEKKLKEAPENESEKFTCYIYHSTFVRLQKKDYQRMRLALMEKTVSKINTT